MFGTGSLDAGTLLGLGVVLLGVGAGMRLAAGRGFDPFPVPLVVGLVLTAAGGPLDVLRPDAAITRAGAELALVVLLFCVGFDHGAPDRRAAAAALPAGRVVAVDAALNFGPGALFGLLAGFGPTGAVLLGGVTWGSSWAMTAGALDRGGRYGNGETPAALTVLVLEHTATTFYLPLAAALLAPGDAASRGTALLGSAATVGFAWWLVLGPAPRLPAGLFAGRATGPALLLVGAALALAGLAAVVGVAGAGVAYLAGVVLATSDPAGVRWAVAGLRDLSCAMAGLALGLLVPAGKLPGAVAGGLVLAALSGATKVLTGWWAAGCLPGPAGADTVGRPGRVRAGLVLVPRGELAVAVGILVALSAPGRGPGMGLPALAAVLVVLTAVGPSLVRKPGRPGWYRWAPLAPAALRPDQSGAG